MKKFKSKKKYKISLFKISFFLILILFFYYTFTNILFKFKLASSNQEFLNYLLQDTNHYKLYDQPNFFEWLKEKFNLTTENMLEKVFGYENIEIFNDEDIGDKSEYVYDPNPTEINTPRVYIYNTHQLEGYSDNNLKDYNITPNVLMASYVLKEKLNKLNIPTIIQTANIKEFLNINNWDYYKSYDASRFYLEETLKNYNNLELIIDFHRDAIDKNLSTVTIDNKEYAKVLFVVGMEHDNYEKNLALANQLNDLIKKNYPTLTRGIITKSGTNVNGVYNQDLSDKTILIEVGGYQNNLEEVINTIDILAEIIKEYLK